MTLETQRFRQPTEFGVRNCKQQSRSTLIRGLDCRPLSVGSYLSGLFSECLRHTPDWSSSPQRVNFRVEIVCKSVTIRHNSVLSGLSRKVRKSSARADQSKSSPAFRYLQAYLLHF